MRNRENSTLHHVKITLVASFICVLNICVPNIVVAQSDSAVEADRNAFFEKHVRPILVQRCQGCHSAKSDKQEGSFLIDSRDTILKGGDRGPAVVPGNVEQSLLIQAVRHTDPDLLMPPTERLTDESIALLEAWIRMGVPFPETPAVSAVSKPSDPIEGRSHWAYRPLAPAQLPDVANADWCRNEIDRFVLARLQEKGISPVPDASDYDLVRRLTVQLTGLSPTAEQLSSFSSLPREQATARLVDELLASPQFGQRWGRHWLDLARYADSNGLDENFLFREAWRYRNWVIDAINADMPYDRFLLEQIAGDLLPSDSIDQRDRQRIASGFLEVGPKVLLGVDPNRQKMDVADEQIETVGRVVLGQTLGCARCHDHKFDPIPTADYYALAGIFTSTVVMEQRFMLNEQRVMERLVGLGEDGERLDDEYEKYFLELAGLKAQAEKAKAAVDSLKSDTEAAIAAKISADADGFAERAKDSALSRELRLAAQEEYLKALVDRLTHPPKIPPRAMIPRESDHPANEHIRLAGKADSRGEMVARGFLQVLNDGPQAVISEKESGRLQLSQWLTDPKTRTGALTARVMANRIWHHLTGRGIVRTVDNFGRTGEPPSDPVLLDYLAAELIRNRWSIKSLIRQIVTSRTFALSSSYDSRNHELDPDNTLVWRANRRRLDPECLRDAMLMAAGTLELGPVDSTVDYLGDQATAVGNNAVRRRTDFNCRSVYLPMIRNDLPELFEAFDFANPHLTSGARPTTTVPVQGLFMLNDPMVMSAAEATARRVIEGANDQVPEQQVERLFELALSRAPTSEEKEVVVAWMELTRLQLESEGRTKMDIPLQVLQLTCHALFASSRFQYLE